MIENNCSAQDEPTVLDSLRVVLHEEVNLGNGLFNNAIFLSFTDKQTKTDDKPTVTDFMLLMYTEFDHL